MGSTERFLDQQAARLAATWRRIRRTQTGEGPPAVQMLDGVVEPFLRQLAASLRGADGSAWARTRGILRLSPARGVEHLNLEFDALGVCLSGTLSTLGAPPPVRSLVLEQLREARASAKVLLKRLRDPAAPGPQVPFGGLVVECFEAARPVPAMRAMPLH